MSSKQEKFDNVVDLMADILPDDDAFGAELSEQIRKRVLVRKLARLRNQKGVTQLAIAELLECQQAKISKLENGFDADVRLGELTAYCKAMECDLQIVIRNKNYNLVDEIKGYAFGIKRCLKLLCTLAKKDENVSDGVANFHVEALLNLVKIVSESANELPDKNRDTISYDVPDLERDDCDQDLATSP